MNVGGVEPAAVYLSPQAISPLSASHEPIALALAVRPDLSEPAGSTASKTANKTHEALEHAKKPTPPELVQPHPTAGAAAVGRVDVYV
jgi:hypothetical protein